MSIPQSESSFSRAQLGINAKERRLQPAEAPFLPSCRVNAAFLSEAFVRVGGGATLRPFLQVFSTSGLGAQGGKRKELFRGETWNDRCEPETQFELVSHQAVNQAPGSGRGCSLTTQN